MTSTQSPLNSNEVLGGASDGITDTTMLDWLEAGMRRHNHVLIFYNSRPNDTPDVYVDTHAQRKNGEGKSLREAIKNDMEISDLVQRKRKDA